MIRGENMHTKDLPPKKTKIVCTIGPASKSQEMLEQLISNGMNVARLNFAHGDFESHAQVIRNIRAAARAVDQQVAIMGDLPGPKMRIGQLEQETVELKRGQSFILQTGEIVGNHERVSMSFDGLPGVVRPSDKIFINDGFIQLAVEGVQKQEVHCKVMVGGELRSYKGVNFPGIDLGISAFTETDHEYLRFAAQQGLDAISQSFVQGPADITIVRQAALAMDYHPFIIAKLERARAVENLEAILDVSDGIMVARGDLGVEIPIEEIALVQKRMIHQANLMGKPVITATHMLEFMIVHSRPTRAEATDVANAILDGTDCVMLSGETAMGHYPAEAVAVMTRIAQITEPCSDLSKVIEVLGAAKTKDQISKENLISLSIYRTVETVRPSVVITPTISGVTSRRLSRFRLPVWILAVSPHKSTCQNLQFSYGVFPVHESERPPSWKRYARNWLEQHGMTEKLALLTQGTSRDKTGGTDHIEILDPSLSFSETSIW